MKYKVNKKWRPPLYNKWLETVPGPIYEYNYDYVDKKVKKNFL